MFVSVEMTLIQLCPRLSQCRSSINCRLFFIIARRPFQASAVIDDLDVDPVFREKLFRSIPNRNSKIPKAPSADTHSLSFSHCKSSEDIIHHLEGHPQSLHDDNTYIEAMKMCHKLKGDDPRSVHRIFNLLLESTPHSTLRVFHFNTFFHSVPDSPLLCSRYFRAMTGKYALTPDLLTFTALIKGCKSQIRSRTAGKYWYLMKDKYRIKPANALYAEMMAIYVKSGKLDRAHKIFNEYLLRIKRKELEADAFTLRVYLSVFTSNGDRKGMKRALSLCRQFGIKMDSRFIAEIMRGYLNANAPDKVLRIYDKYTLQKLSFNPMMLDLRCKALLQCIERESDEERKCALYEEMECLTKRYWKLNGFQNVCCLLDAVIAVYGQRDPSKVSHTLEWMEVEGMTQFKKYKEAEGGFVVDLHQFPSQRAASFVLQYCVSHKLDDLAPNGQDLRIVVGQGLHSKRTSNKKGVMAQFVVNELLSYDPPIESSLVEDNKGMLIVPRSSLIPHITTPSSNNSIA